jgi:hypothetical protein
LFTASLHSKVLKSGADSKLNNTGGITQLSLRCNTSAEERAEKYSFPSYARGGSRRLNLCIRSLDNLSRFFGIRKRVTARLMMYSSSEILINFLDKIVGLQTR